MNAPRYSRVDQLRTIEAALAERPGDPGLRFERAQCLDDLGRVEEAMYAYRDVLTCDAVHFGALTNLGTLFVEQDRLEGAAVCFRAAAHAAPGDPLAHLNLALLHAAAGTDAAARATYEDVLARFATDDQAYAHAHNGLARLAERRGDRVAAAHHAAAALARPVMWTFPATDPGSASRVLQLTSARGGDLISNQFFDERTVERIAIVPESFATASLPEHDLIFNGIGEPDASRSTLAAAVELVGRSRAPVINHPAAVLRTDREAVMARLAGTPGAIVPRTRRFARDGVRAATLAAAGFTFPLLLRSPGFHAGTNVERVDDPAQVAAALARLPGDDVYAIAFHDAAGADGWVRKYRVAFIDGRPYPIHLALARQWKVHYFSAAMADEPEHRAEEDAFLRDPEAVLGTDGMSALRTIGAQLGLDYGGVDFGRAADGRIIAFEANATMTINAPPDDARWDYRRLAHERAIGAVRAMIAERARQR